MNQDPVQVSKVHWQQTFPLLRLIRATTLGTGLAPLILATLCLIISWTGSAAANRVLSSGSITAVCEFPWPEYARWTEADSSPLTLRELRATNQVLPATVGVVVNSTSRTLSGRDLSGFPDKSTAEASVPWLLSLDLVIWNALVLGFFATAIGRSVSQSFCIQTRSGVLQSLRYAGQHARDVLITTGLIIAFMSFLRLMLQACVLINQTGSFGSTVTGLFWGPIYLLAFALLLVFSVGGSAWTLSLSAIGTDRCTGADALSRCISYLLSHRLWAIAGLISVGIIATALKWIAHVLLLATHHAIPQQLSLENSGTLGQLWVFGIAMIPHAVHLSVFLSGLTILYVLLRQREDGINLEEVDGAS